MDSSDEALCEMLGLTSLSDFGDDNGNSSETRVNQFGVPALSDSRVKEIVQANNLSKAYAAESVCVFPNKLAVPDVLMRRITDELIWGGSKVQADRTYETIRNRGEERRVLTRLENFVGYHDDWSRLCNGHIRQCVSALFGEEMVLYKEKLNLKPPGGSGFAPHLDSPSLRVALGENGPQTFVTVMVAIDKMTSTNGCLRICKGPWSEQNYCDVVAPDKDGNPDAGGRAGAIPKQVAENLQFDNVLCESGGVVAFNGWAPHRSAANASPFPRRAVFLTYNPKREGDFHDRYYERMAEIRSQWRAKIGWNNNTTLTDDEKMELKALSTIPRI